MPILERKLPLKCYQKEELFEIFPERIIRHNKYLVKRFIDWC